ncbi:CIC11C00000000951 [Sungouiella intermedia]|uniref:CIC11C00000000951 n=1 Tax=Sungouiella intermedia TaxID=45354 RepID=A0A1L0CVM4_9ASCO|nr:CIC11C00000000951 [[Candida] intermedia]
MEKKHHFRNIFKKDGDSESKSRESRSRSASHSHLPKIFHRDHHHDKQESTDQLDAESMSTSMSKLSLVLLLKRNDTNAGMLAPVPAGRMPVRRAETLNHFGPKRGPLPTTKPTGLGHHEKIKYNPYGINKLLLNQATHLALYISNFPIFKNNEDYTKGPGSEFKWAAQFHSPGAARVAWKLCDPSLTLRYTLEDLFKDPWFTTLEMCVYEHLDQHVDPFMFSHHSSHSGAPSHQSSRAASRKNTITSYPPEEPEAPDIHTPVRSMLDMAGVGAAPATPTIDSDNVSIKSNSLLTHTPLRLAHEDKPFRLQRTNSEVSMNLNSSGSSVPKVRSMLDVGASPDRAALPRVAEDEVANTSSSQLPIVEEDDIHGEQCNLGEEPELQVQQEAIPPEVNLDSSIPTPSQTPALEGHASFLYQEPLHDTDDLKIDSSGYCELGYKLKKHHHLDVSTVLISGSKSRR